MVHELAVPISIARKPASYRTQRRAAQFARCFQDSEVHQIQFSDVSLAGTWLTGDSPMAPHHLKFLSQALGVRVYYAELRARHLGMVTGSAPPDAARMGNIVEQFKPESVTVTQAAHLKHLLVGLSDGPNLIGLGSIDSINFRRQALLIRTAIRVPSAAGVIHFGGLRVRPDGRELGTVRPSDL